MAGDVLWTARDGGVIERFRKARAAQGKVVTASTSEWKYRDDL